MTFAMHEHVADLMLQKKLVVIAGPCVIESYDLCAQVAEFMQNLCAQHNVGYVFKASFDKANRTAMKSFRGSGLEAGLHVLERIKTQFNVPVTSDIHLPEHASQTASVLDILQIPAFLCRQTDLLVAAAQSGRPINVKKGQFLAPEDMKHVVHKLKQAGAEHVAVCERGTTFGYHNLVVDMRGLIGMKQATQGAPVVFDATHSVQRPSSGDGTTGGDRTYAPVLARAAAAVGINGLFCEVHPNPDQALSDGPNSLTFDLIRSCLEQVVAIHTLAQSWSTH